MRIYHGTTFHVKKPIVERGRQETDFSKGFYTTTNFDQAKRWALKKQESAKEQSKAIVNIYEIDDDLLNSGKFRVMRFDEPDKRWLDFVVDCRRGKTHDYEIIFGPVANDTIYATITLYESGVLNAEQTIAGLKVNEIFDQISFHSPIAVRELSYVESVDVTEE